MVVLVVLLSLLVGASTADWCTDAADCFTCKVGQPLLSSSPWPALIPPHLQRRIGATGLPCLWCSVLSNNAPLGCTSDSACPTGSADTPVCQLPAGTCAVAADCDSCVVLAGLSHTNLQGSPQQCIWCDGKRCTADCAASSSARTCFHVDSLTSSLVAAVLGPALFLSSSFVVGLALGLYVMVRGDRKRVDAATMQSLSRLLWILSFFFVGCSVCSAVLSLRLAFVAAGRRRKWRFSHVVLAAGAALELLLVSGGLLTCLVGEGYLSTYGMVVVVPYTLMVSLALVYFSIVVLGVLRISVGAHVMALALLVSEEVDPALPVFPSVPSAQQPAPPADFE